MDEIVIGAVLIAVIAYTAGFFTGQFISRKQIRKLTLMYGDAVAAARYVATVLDSQRDRDRYMNLIDRLEDDDGEP